VFGMNRGYKKLTWSQLFKNEFIMGQSIAQQASLDPRFRINTNLLLSWSNNSANDERVTDRFFHLIVRLQYKQQSTILCKRLSILDFG